jgi:uncharacterized lipoprotein NlpE involved in copper resistance
MRFFTLITCVAVALLSVGCDEDSDNNPSGPSNTHNSEVVGSWTGALDIDSTITDPETQLSVGLNITGRFGMNIKADNSFTSQLDGNVIMNVPILGQMSDTLAIQEAGSWSITNNGDSISFVPTTCLTYDPETRTMVADTACEAWKEKINISGNTWSFHDEDLGQTLVLTRQ